MSKNYKIVGIIGDFKTIIGKVIIADNEELAKEYILEHIREDIDKYLYSVVELVGNEEE